MAYTNSPLVTYTNLTKNKTTNRKQAIDTITIHCIVGQWTAKQGCDYFSTTDRQCSANYVVGRDGSIGLSVEEKDRSWCTSSSANDNRAITIEVASDTKHPYAVTDEAYKALIELVADICKRNGIKKLVWSENKDERKNHLNGCNMTVHRDYANKSCPGEYLYSRHGEIAELVNKKLNAEPTKPSFTETNDTWYCKKGLNQQLDRNFKSSEFDCHCSGYCDETVISKKLVKYLQQIRDYFNKPVTINSGYRCERHNKNIGGVTNSYHRSGEAADIVVKDVKPLEVARYAEKIGLLGIGLYETDADGYFVHVDVRKVKSFWYGQAQAKRDTFQEVKVEEPKEEKPTTTNLTYRDFKVGEVVQFIGDTHYLSASSKIAKQTKASRAKVTAIYESGIHQLHLRAVNEAGSYIGGVYGWVDISDVKKIASEPKVGDIVQFTGKTHYASSTSTKGYSVKPGLAKITAISKKASHPYHLRAVTSDGKFTSGVYGWVNAKDIKLI